MNDVDELGLDGGVQTFLGWNEITVAGVAFRPRSDLLQIVTLPIALIDYI